MRPFPVSPLLGVMGHVAPALNRPWSHRRGKPRRDRKQGGQVSRALAEPWTLRPVRCPPPGGHSEGLLPHRKRPLSPPSKSSSKVTSVPGKASDAGPAGTASAGAKSGKASTLSRREELLKQLKAVEDAIARKRAKIPGKV